MSMRSQVYEWANLAPTGSSSALRRAVDDIPVFVAANREYDVFIGGIGNNITKPAETTATQFIVIEDIACTPYLGGAVQVRINTTDVFNHDKLCCGYGRWRNYSRNSRRMGRCLCRRINALQFFHVK